MDVTGDIPRLYCNTLPIVPMIFDPKLVNLGIATRNHLRDRRVSEEVSVESAVVYHILNTTSDHPVAD